MSANPFDTITSDQNSPMIRNGKQNTRRNSTNTAHSYHPQFCEILRTYRKEKSTIFQNVGKVVRRNNFR